MKIAPKIILLIILAITIVMGVAGWITIQHIEKEMISAGFYRLSSSLDFATEELKEQESDNLRTSELIAHNPAISRALSLDSSAEINAILNHIQQTYPNFNYIMVLTADGDVFAVNTLDKNGNSIASVELLGLSVTKHSSFMKSASKSETFAGAPGLDPFLASLGMKEKISQWFVTPVLKGSTRIGWVVVSYDWQSEFTIFLSRIRNQLIPLGNPVLDISLLDENDKVILNSTSPRDDALPSSDKIVMEKTLPFGTSFMKLVISSQKSAIYQPIVDIVAHFTGALGLATLFLLGTLYLILQGTVLRRIESIKKGSTAFRGGNLEYRLPPMGEDELGILASTFNEMGQSLQEASNNLENQVMERTAELKASEERMRRLFEKNSSVMILIEPDTGRIIDANQAAERFYGYPVSVLQSMSIQQINVLPDEEIKRQMEMASVERLNIFTFPHRLENGEIRTVEVYSSPIEQRGVTVLFSIIHDVTDRKRLEDSLAQKTSLLECLLNSIPDIIFFKDKNGVYLGCNEQCASFMGRKKEDVSGLTDYDLLPKDMADSCAENDRLMLETGFPRHNEEWGVYPDGRGVLLETVKAPLKSSDGITMGILGVSRDITERKYFEEQLFEKTSLLESLLDSIPDMVFFKDMHGVYLGCNPEFESFVGRSREEIVGKTDYDLFDRSVADFFREQDSLMIDQGAARKNEEWVTYPDGSSKLLDTFKAPLRFVKGVPIGIIGVSRDITDRKQMEESLRKSEEKLRIVADYTHDWEYWNAPNGSLIYVSPSCERITGFTATEFMNKPGLLQDIVHPEDSSIVCDHLALASDTQHSDLQFRIITRSGETRWISHSCQSVFALDGACLGRRSSNHDITYEKEMSQELMENQSKLLNAYRLESLAIMAGGIAHDFNNQLMTVLGNLELALGDTPVDSRTRTRIETAIGATNRSAELSNQMLAYTGQKYFRSDNLNVQEFIDKQSSLMRSAIGASVTLDIRDNGDLPTIVGDEDQLKQVLINLVKNASEAIGDEQGEVRLITGLMNCDKSYLAQSRLEQEPDPGWFVFFDVSDNGCGMDEETQARIFDPFFSTKFWGRGLGMAETSGIVKSHNGAIILNSQPGKGTTVRVLLPVPAPEQTTVASVTELEEPASTLPELTQRPKTILIVEDEDTVRLLCTELLELFGYDTIAASDGVEGVEMFKANQNRIDLVLLDLLMPRMNGMEAFTEFVKIKPDVKVLISSGFTKEALAEQIKGVTPAGYLHKPYQMEILREEIDRILGA